MGREPNGELLDVALIAQAGKEPLHEGEAGRQSARGELMAAGRVNPGINIACRATREASGQGLNGDTAEPVMPITSSSTRADL